MKTLFVVNRRSGLRRRYDIATLIRAQIGGGAGEVLPCESKSELDTIIASAAERGFDSICAVGGDGTVHEVAKRLIGTSLAMSILPTGSGNGFARHLGIPLDAREAIRLSENGRITTIDTATANGVPFVNVMGVGFDALVAEQFAQSRVRGIRTYLREGIRVFRSIVAEDYEVTIDGQVHRQSGFLVSVANSSQYGNNARIAPLASLQDGLLDVVIITEASLLSAPVMVMRLFTGTLNRARGVVMHRAAEVIIERQKPGPAHLDGEPVNLPERLEITVRPASLRVVVPWGDVRF